MNVSFNGARKNLARAYNTVARDPSHDNLNDLRNVVVAFLCMYDDNINGDFDNLIDEVQLVDVLEETAVDLVTYTRLDESGTSLKAAGWIDGGETDGGEYDRPSRPRQPALFPDPK